MNKVETFSGVSQYGVAVRTNDRRRGGLWVDDDRQEHDLVSGETDLYEDLKKFLVDNKIGRSDGHLMVMSHVGAKFAMFMRRTGRMHETVAVIKLLCKGQWGCEELLGRILPPDATLTVFGPDKLQRDLPLETKTRTNGFCVSGTVTAYFKHEHGDNPVILKTAADVDALIDAMLAEDFDNSVAALYSDARPLMDSGLPDHELRISIYAEAKVGGIRYAG